MRSFPEEITLFASRIAVLIFLIAAFGGAFVFYVMRKADPWTDCNVAVIPLMGEIGFGYDPTGTLVNADDVVASLNTASEAEGIDAVLLRIDSPGGFIVSSEVIEEAVRLFPKPIIAQIREVGASGAYLVASAADTIVASANSTVGSIGVTGSYISHVEQNKKEGREFIELVAGAYKEVGNPNRTLSEEERASLERELEAVRLDMVKRIAENRKLPVSSVEKVSDGSAFLGSAAKEAGLIDVLGGESTTKEILSSYVSGDVSLCRVW